MKKILLLSVFLYPLFASSQSQWQPTKGPYGGNVQVFYEYNNALYAGTSAGLFVTTDNGGNWKFIDVGYPISATAIAQMGGRIFVGTQGEGIYCSSDNGVSWKKINSGLSTWYRVCGYCITGFSVVGNKILAGTGDGLFKLENNDTTWANIHGGYNNSFASNGSIIVSSNWAQYGPIWSSEITTDAGLTFRNISFPDTLSSNAPSFAFSWDISSHGLFAVRPYDLYFSTDSGYSWISLYHDTGDYRPTIVKVIDDKIYLATDGKGLLVSSVNNISWTNDGLPNMNVGTLYKSNQTIFAGMGYSRGIFANANSSNWIEKNNGLSAMNISSIESFDNVIVAGCTGAVMISVDTGYTWIRHDIRFPGKPHDRDNNFGIEKIATNGKMILAGSGNIFFSLDSGITWGVMNQTFNPYELAGLAIIGNRFIVCEWGELYYSDDYGQSWQTGQLPAGNGLWWDMTQSSNALFLSGGGGNGAPENIFTSKDSGTTWNIVPKPSAIASSGYSLFLNATDSILFAVDGASGLFIGLKDGSNWHQSYINNPNNYFADYKIGIKGNDVFMSDYMTLPGLMHSPDLGQTWFQEPIFMNYKAEQLGSSKYFAFVSVPGFGIWRYGSQNGILNAIVENSKLNNFQVFPNPSSGKFTIESSQNFSSIEIINPLGEKIYSATVNSKQEAVALSSQSKGIYFVEMFFGNERRTRKIIIE